LPSAEALEARCRSERVLEKLKVGEKRAWIRGKGESTSLERFDLLDLLFG